MQTQNFTTCMYLYYFSISTVKFIKEAQSNYLYLLFLVSIQKGNIGLLGKKNQCERANLKDFPVYTLYNLYNIYCFLYI